jgi:predicted esterase
VAGPVSIHTIPATTHGRYCVRAPAGTPAGLLVGFHGYGENAEACLAELDSVPFCDTWLLVAVQGLHRFYNRAGDVVASWMTSQDRELALADNVSYVRGVVAAVRAAQGDVEAGAMRPVFLGFSQGVAMAFRAAVAHGADCDGVIALGGDIPPEIRAGAACLPRVLIARGDKDDWYTAEKFAIDRAWLASAGIDATVCEHHGGHAWTEEFRAAAGQFLRRDR